MTSKTKPRSFSKSPRAPRRRDAPGFRRKREKRHSQGLGREASSWAGVGAGGSGEELWGFLFPSAARAEFESSGAVSWTNDRGTARPGRPRPLRVPGAALPGSTWERREPPARGRPGPATHGKALFPPAAAGSRGEKKTPWNERECLGFRAGCCSGCALCLVSEGSAGGALDAVWSWQEFRDAPGAAGREAALLRHGEGGGGMWRVGVEVLPGPASR